MKKIIMAMVAFLLIGISGGIVLAYLSGEDAKINVISGTQTDIEVLEEYDPPRELIPGREIRKIPRIRNLAKSPCYVRVKVLFSDKRAEQFCEKLEILDGWTLREDGYYHWKEKLQPEETTGPLFTRVVIQNDVKKEDLKQFELSIYAEAAYSAGEEEQVWKILSHEKER